jgi:glyoxylase-like metal-dependent hydrolase (beta-lactamase superfamily II)
MKMHFLSCGRIRMRKSTYLPDADRSEMIDLPVASALIRHSQGNVLFDSGCHPSIAENAEARWGALTKFMTPIMTRDDNAVSGLKGIGLGPDDIDVVICSHLHTDHCGCNAFFKKATVMVHARELEAARGSDAARNGYVNADWDHPMPMTEVTGECDVMGDGKITIIPLPGHTPGLVGVMVGLDRSGGFLLASDALSVRENPRSRHHSPQPLECRALRALFRRDSEAGSVGIQDHLRPRCRAMAKHAQGARRLRLIREAWEEPRCNHRANARYQTDGPAAQRVNGRSAHRHQYIKVKCSSGFPAISN